MQTLSNRKPKGKETATEVLVFATELDAGQGMARARLFVEDLNSVEPKVNASLINRLSSMYSDLERVAKHGVVTSPTVIVLRGKETLARWTEIPPVSIVREVSRVV